MSTVSPGLTATIPFAAPRGHSDNAEQRHADAEMGEGRAPHRTRQTDARIKLARIGSRRIMVRSANVGHRAGHDETPRCPPRTAPAPGPPCSISQRRRPRRTAGEHRGGEQALRRADDIAAFPSEQRPNDIASMQRNEQRTEGRVEERRADGNLVAGQGFQRQRIERADETVAQADVRNRLLKD